MQESSDIWLSKWRQGAEGLGWPAEIPSSQVPRDLSEAPPSEDHHTQYHSLNLLLTRHIVSLAHNPQNISGKERLSSITPKA